MASKPAYKNPHRINPFDSRSQGEFSLRFFLLAIVTFSSAAGIAFGLAYVLPARLPAPTPRMPLAFVPSTLLLLYGSYTLAKAIVYVRQEKQILFRRCLLRALIVGTLFVGVQSFGMWKLVNNQLASPQMQPAGNEESAITAKRQQELRKRPMGEQFRDDYNISTGTNGFVLVFVAMHGLHFFVALLFLIFVMLRAYGNRYDHEYHWGVTVCTGFWHVLGLAWMAILAVFAIAIRAL